LQGSFLNQDILKLRIKGAGQIPKLLQIEIVYYDEMNDKIFDIDIDMKVWDNARNAIEPISFHQFHGPSIGPHMLCPAVSHSFISISCCLVRGDCASMCLAIWLSFHVWPALTELGYWRYSVAPSFDRLCLKRLESTPPRIPIGENFRQCPIDIPSSMVHIAAAYDGSRILGDV
jgi:hypothetical protein